MYRAMFYVKDPRVKKLELTDLGKQLLTLTGIKQDTIMRRDLAYFERQFAEADIATLHYGHYCKRREKNLMKLQEQYKIRMMAERQMREHTRSSNDLIKLKESQSIQDV